MIYHVLNGDALGDRFPEQIEGKKIILRECFCYGPLKLDPEELWSIREEFLESLQSEISYADYVIPELKKLDLIKEDDQVICWFEEDLFCQANFWFTINRLSKRTKNISFVLPYSDPVYGFSALNPAELIKAQETALTLNQDQIESLSRLWKAFVSNIVEIGMAIAESNQDSLPFLMEAVIAWKVSTPQGSPDSHPIQALREISNELGTEEFRKIYPVFHKRYPIYGYGDLIVEDLWRQARKSN